MKKSNSKQKALGAFKKLGVVALITADTTVSVSFEPNPVEGGAVLILSPDHLNIKVSANTEDGSDITVEGCTETRLASDTKTTLHARGTTVILKGKIIQLNCGNNKLTALNVQGLTALKQFGCFGNKLNAQAMTELLNALPAREASDKAIAKLYLDYTYEGNCKDFSTPESLKTALDGAKKRNWKLIKKDANGKDAEIE